MTLGDFSVRNSVLINILTVLILVLGVFSVSRLPQEQLSEVPFFFINISVPYPGVSAEDIEETVTAKIENEMQGLDRLSTYQSVTQDGIAQVSLQFEEDINRREFDRVFQDAQNRFASLDLPDGVGQEDISEFSSNDFLPVIEVVLSGNVNYETLNRTADTVADRLSTVREVSSVEIVGARDRKVFVDADPEMMNVFNIGVNDLAQAIEGRNATVPGGSLTTESRQFLLRTVGGVEGPDDLESVVLRTTEGAAAGGNSTGIQAASGMIRVSDVATVEEGYDADGVSARFNGEQSISLRVAKVPGGSSVDIVEDIRERMDELSGSVIPESLSVSYVNDSTVQINQSIDVLVSNALLGLALLVVILLLFIGLRNALATALGIPVAFGITFVVLELTGETLNGNSLFALVLVLGLIVDHAIVIVENSYRLEQGGLDRRQAAIQGVNQVAFPVWAATLTTVAAFLPLAFLPGIIGRFLRVVPITVTIALLASTFEASVFLPSHYADWPGRGSAGIVSRMFDRLRDKFRTVLSAIYRRRGIAIIAMLLFTAGSFSLVGGLTQDFFAADDASLYYIDITMPPGTPIDKTDEVVSRYEDRLLSRVGDNEYRAITAYVGFTAEENQNVTDPTLGQLVVDLYELDEGRERSVLEILEEAENATSDIAGPENVRFRRQATGPPVDAPIVYRFFGDSYEQLSTAAELVRAELETVDGVFDIRDNLELSSPELRVLVDDNEAARYGLTRAQVGDYIRAGFDGRSAGTIFSDNEETEVLVRYAMESPNRVESLLELGIPAADGTRIPLSSVAQVRDAQAFASIQRFDGQREVTIEAEALERVDLAAIDERIERVYQQEVLGLAPDVEIETEGQFAQFQNLLFDVLRVFVVGVFIIYLILATQFKSYTQPVLILLSVPFAFVGVVWFLALSGTALSSIVLYAAVALAGIAVNDSIVLISFIKEHKDDGLPLGDAIVEAATVRLRPILLTSLTTIAGLTPTALGLAGESVIWGPMASTIIFGLIFSTITTLVVIPCFFGLLYDRRKKGSDHA